ncbi:MAG: hypothetical protein ACJASQ_002727 [Crocinitomicaceae bacterium]|jgi:hypothetical protein
MNRVSVQSSNISSIGYDASSQTLQVQFNSGDVYEYYSVPPSEHSGLMNASSHGKYLNANIKGSYDYQQV